MIEIKGKDGSIKIEKRFSKRSDCIVYNFYYKNDDIDFSSQDLELSDVKFITLHSNLERMLNYNTNSVMTEKISQEPKTRLRKIFKSIFFFLYFEEPIENEYNKCFFWENNNIVILDFERIKETSNCLISFIFLYGYMSDIKLEGFFVISKEALIKFNQELYQFIQLKL